MKSKLFVTFTRCRTSCSKLQQFRVTGASAFRAGILHMVLLLLVPAGIYAQPQIHATGVHAWGSQVDVRFHVRCGNGFTQQFTMQNMMVEDNQQDLTANATLQCNGVGGISAALVFDASGSMSGPGNAAAKEAGRIFIDSLDGVIDEATVIWFSTVVNIQQQMTTIKPLLYGAVDAIPALGGTAVWDAVYAGLIELINNGVNSTRVVIVLTDGVDAASTRTPDEIINLARRNRIPVFNVLLGDHGDDVELRQIADETYGGFYQCDDGAEVLVAYDEIYEEIRAATHDCVISYTGACPDGREHWVNLGVLQTCGGDDTTNIAYTALYDSSFAQEVYMSFGDISVSADAGTVRVPLNLDTPIGTGIFRSCFINMRYDTSYLSFRSAVIPAGSLIEGVTLNVTEFPSKSVNLETMSDKLVSGTGNLLELEFDVKSVFDTTCARIWARTSRFERTCNFPSIDTGHVCISPGIPSAGCSMDCPPGIVWDNTIDDYAPNPFSVKMRTYNTTGTPARNVSYRIEIDTSVVELLSPRSDTQPGSPADIPPNSSQEIQWILKARPQAAAVDVPVRIVASFDNRGDIVCRATLHLSAAEPGLYCSISIPTLVRDDNTGFYAPSPFPAMVTVHNLGGVVSDSLYAELEIPPDLEYVLPDSPAGYRKLMNPALLPPGQQSTVQWMLRPRRAEMHNRVVPIRSVVPQGTDRSTHCSVALTLPPWRNPAFSTTLQQSAGRVFCSGESVTLAADTGFADYLWSTGEKDRSITVTESGTYYCTVWNAMGRLGRSDTVVAVKHPLPQPMLMVFGQVPLCFGDSLQLTPGGDFVEYQWNTGETESILTVKSAGTYFVHVTDANGCMGYSDTLVVTMLPPPVKPVITREGDLLRTGMYPQYQWYRDGQPVPGATADSLVLRETGSYTVLVTGDNGCTNSSEPLVVAVLGMESLHASAFEFSLYPNPAYGEVLLRVDLPSAGMLHIALVDMLGRQVRIVERRTSSGTVHEIIDLEGLAPGMYLLRLSTDSRHTSRTMMLLHE